MFRPSGGDVLDSSKEPVHRIGGTDSEMNQKRSSPRQWQGFFVHAMQRSGADEVKS